MFKLHGDYATVKEASEILKVNESYVRHLLRSSQIPGAVKIGTNWIIPVVNGQIKTKEKDKR